MLVLILSLGTAFVVALTSPRCDALVMSSIEHSSSYSSSRRPSSPHLKKEIGIIGRRAFVGSTASIGSSFIALNTGIIQPSCAAAASTTTTSVAAAATTTTSKIGRRLEEDILVIPPPSYSSELNGVDNTYFPSYLVGTWDVTQTLVDVKAPLGLKFVGGPNGDIEIAKASLKQSEEQIDKPVQLQLRYLPTKWGVAEDRIFNVKSRLNAFAGRSVVASVDYANVGGSNRQSVLTLGGSETDPLQTTITRFKGPAAQKSFIVSHGGDPIFATKMNVQDDQSSPSWSGYELQRSIFALTNQNQAPPITTDSELIWNFQKIDDNRIEAKLRIAAYLNAQQDRLYFEAGKKAVTLQDYTLVMTRVTE